MKKFLTCVDEQPKLVKFKMGWYRRMHVSRGLSICWQKFAILIPLNIRTCKLSRESWSWKQAQKKVDHYGRDLKKGEKEEKMKKKMKSLKTWVTFSKFWFLRMRQQNYHKTRCWWTERHALVFWMPFFVDWS